MDIEKFLMKKFSGNALARAIDRVSTAIFALAVVFCALWLLGAGLLRSLVIAILSSAALCFFLALLRRRRFESFKQKYLASLAEKCLLERLILLSPGELLRAVRPIFERKHEKLTPCGGGFLAGEVFCCVIANHPDAPINATQIARLGAAMRRLGAKKALIAGLAEPDGAARALGARLGVEYAARGELLEVGRAFGAVEPEVRSALAAQAAQERIEIKKLRAALFRRKKAGAYLLCAAVLTGWSFFSGFSVIYPLIAGLCVIMAYISLKTASVQEA